MASSLAAASKEAQFVTLGLGAEVFGVPVAYVREILDYRAPFAIPEGPKFLLGLIDVRGRGTPMIDLRVKLGMPHVPPDPMTRVLVLDVPLEDRMLSLALVADRVIEVVTFQMDKLETAPDVGVAWRSDYIAGVMQRETDFVVLFDLPRLLTKTEAARLSAPMQQAA